MDRRITPGRDLNKYESEDIDEWPADEKTFYCGSTPEASALDDDTSNESTSDDAVPVEVNTPVIRKRSRAKAELHLDGDADESDEDSYNRQQREAVIDGKDDEYVEVEDQGRRSESVDMSSINEQSD